METKTKSQFPTILDYSKMATKETKEVKDFKSDIKKILGMVEGEKKMNVTKEIFEYVKDGKDRKVGILVAQRFGKTVSIGWSKTNFKSGDVFKKDEGLKFARARLHKDLAVQTIPQLVERRIHPFIVRCARYYKGIRNIGVSAV